MIRKVKIYLVYTAEISHRRELSAQPVRYKSNTVANDLRERPTRTAPIRPVRSAKQARESSNLIVAESEATTNWHFPG